MAEVDVENKKSRTKQTIKNAGASLGENLIKMFIKFLSRYVFVITLSSTYLGVNALFSSVITMLSLADLGFSIALPQSLYKPLAEKDENRICQIIKFYSKVYLAISGCILCFGLALLPFLNVIIGNHDTSGIDNLNLIYVLFIINSASSYLFVYKRTIFTADQRNYFVTIVDSVTSILSTVVQIVILLTTHNYILFLLVSIVAVIVQNIFIAHQCDKQYPFLKNLKGVEPLSKDDRIDLRKKIYALFIYKAASAVETGTDNLIMTSFAGLVITGLCSNYTLITTSMTSILLMVMASATASIGNVIVTESKERTYEVYSLLNFISFWVYAVCGICCAVLIEPFIVIWLGEQYVIEASTAIMLCVNFYVCGVQNVNSNFRNAYGLFYEGRYRPICMILINIGSSILLAKWIGVTGIFVGTLLSRIFTVGTFDPYIVFKYGLKAPLKKYYLSHGVYHAATIAAGALLYVGLSFWTPVNIVSWLGKAIVSFVLINVFFAVIFHNSTNYKKMKSLVLEVLHVKQYFGN